MKQKTRVILFFGFLQIVQVVQTMQQGLKQPPMLDKAKAVYAAQVSPQERAAQAAQLRLDQQQQKLTEQEIKQQNQEPLFFEKLNNDTIIVVQLVVRGQFGQNWPKSMQSIAVQEGGNCGYHALFNVIQLSEILQNLPETERCQFRGDIELKNNILYQNFMQDVAIPFVQKYRKAREQDEFDYQLILARKATEAQVKQAKPSQAKEIETPEQKARNRVNNWLVNLSWLGGHEIGRLLGFIGNLEIPVMIVEYLAGHEFAITDQQRKKFENFRNSASVGSMLGLIWNDGIVDQNRGASGFHWVGMVAVKCAGGTIILFVMDSAGMNTNVDHAVQVLSGQVVESRQVLTAQEALQDMRDMITKLSHSDRVAPPKLHDVIDIVLNRWKTFWMSRSIQMEFLLLMQNLLAFSANEELQELLNNERQLQINLTRHPQGEHEVNAVVFNAILNSIKERLNN